MLIRLDSSREMLHVAGRAYPFADLARSSYATVVMLLHMAVIACTANRRLLDTELFTEHELVAMLSEAQ